MKLLETAMNVIGGLADGETGEHKLNEMGALNMK